MNLRFENQDSPAQAPLKPFVKEFLTDRMQEVSELNLAVSNENYKLVKEIAHKWKGFSDPYGFNTLTPYAKELEKAAHNQSQSLCEDLLKEIHFYLREKKPKLDE